MKEGILRQLMDLIYAIPIIVLALRSELGLTVKETFYIILGYAVAISIFRISKAVEDGSKAVEKGIIVKIQSSHSNPNSNPNGNKEKAREGAIPPEEEEVRTSGAGAFAGMIAGGTIGLLFGPAGVLICGLIGAMIGNQLEYNQELERKKREKKKVYAKIK